MGVMSNRHNNQASQGLSSYHEPKGSDQLHVREDRYVPGAFVVASGSVEHSFVDLDDPIHVEFPYMERICELFDTWLPAGQRMRIIHIGGAGMTLARYVAYTRPTSPQIVLEPNAALTEEVRQRLPLPSHSGIKVRPVDGRSGLAAMRDDYAEMIIVDAFAQLSVPGELVTTQAFAEMARVLRPTGVVAMNITDDAPFPWTHRVLAGAGHYFSELAISAEPATFKGRRMGNLVVLASNRQLPMRDLVRAASSASFPYRWVYGNELDQWRGAPEPFDDSHPVPSPVNRDARTHFE